MEPYFNGRIFSGRDTIIYLKIYFLPSTTVSFSFRGIKLSHREIAKVSSIKVSTLTLKLINLKLRRCA